MRTLLDVLDHIAFHPATPEAAVKYDRVRRYFMKLANDIWPLLPDGPDKTIAMRKIVEAQRECIAVIAVAETPADHTNPQVARVLPHGDVTLETTLPGDRMDTRPAATCSCGGLTIPMGAHTARQMGSDIVHRRRDDGDCG